MKKFVFASAAALTALTSAQAAEAQQSCYASADLTDTAIYMLPIAYDAAKSACGKQLEPSGFMAQSGDEFVAPFRAKQARSWPGAFRVMKRQLEGRSFSGMSGASIVNLLSSAPASTVRPMVDGMLGQAIVEEIKPKDCPRIERGIELLSPLPSENVAHLFPYVAEIANLTNFQVCDPRRK
jgi:hypothetical protein